MNYSVYFKKIARNKYQYAANRLSRKRYVVSYKDKIRIIELLESTMIFACRSCVVMAPLSLLSLKSAIVAGFLILTSIIGFYIYKISPMKANFEVVYLDKREPPLLVYKLLAQSENWSEIFRELKATCIILLFLILEIYSYIKKPSQSLLSFCIITLIIYLLGTFIVVIKTYYKLQKKQ